MPKATLMVRFKRATDSVWMRRPAVLGSTGRVRAGYAVFKDRISGNSRVGSIGESFAYEIRIEDGATTYQPAGRNGADALAQLRRIAARLDAKKTSQSLGLVVIDPEEEQKKRIRLEDSFEDYIDDAKKRGCARGPRAGHAGEAAIPGRSLGDLCG